MVLSQKQETSLVLIKLKDSTWWLTFGNSHTEHVVIVIPKLLSDANCSDNVVIVKGLQAY